MSPHIYKGDDKVTFTINALRGQFSRFSPWLWAWGTAPPQNTALWRFCVAFLHGVAEWQGENEHGLVRSLAISRACAGTASGIGIAVGKRHNGRKPQGGEHDKDTNAS